MGFELTHYQQPVPQKKEKKFGAWYLPRPPPPEKTADIPKMPLAKLLSESPDPKSFFEKTLALIRAK